MTLKIDNSGAVDLANNWSAGGRTRHIETRMFYLRDMKEAGIIKTVWLRGDENPVDMFTKNLAGPAFQKCAKVFDETISTTRGRFHSPSKGEHFRV